MRSETVMVLVEKPANDRTGHRPDEQPRPTREVSWTGGSLASWDDLVLVLVSTRITPIDVAVDDAEGGDVRLDLGHRDERVHSGNPAFRRPSIINFAFEYPPRATNAVIVKAGSSSSRRAAASRASASRPR
jgi:hypothetical protein